jgi:Co/Zn/Cd efflux system component
MKKSAKIQRTPAMTIQQMILISVIALAAILIGYFAIHDANQPAPAHPSSQAPALPTE